MTTGDGPEVPKNRSFLQRFLGRLSSSVGENPSDPGIQDQIKINPQDPLVQEIKIGAEVSPEVDKGLLESLKIGSEMEESKASSDLVDEKYFRLFAERNKSAATMFVKAIRENYREFMPFAKEDYSNPDQQIHIGDISGYLLNRWNLPALIAFDRSAGHVMLALKAPELIDGRWQVLVYDPMREQDEYFYPLPFWNPDQASQDLGKHLVENGFYLNESALGWLEKGEYDLALAGEEEEVRIANAAKRTETQPKGNISDCTLLVTFMAALRWSYKEGFNIFKDYGRKNLEDDTGIHIQSREEILREIQKMRQGHQITE